MNKQKKINRMLKNIKCSRVIYSTYGKWIKIMAWHIVAVLDRFIPTFGIPTIIAKKKFGHIEAFRFTYSNK